MKLRTTLFQIAALAAAATGAGACSSSGSTVTPAGVDGGGADANAADASPEASPICGGCYCGSPAVTQANATPEQACAIASGQATQFNSVACKDFCQEANDGANGSYYCTVPADYTNAFGAVQTDAGAGDASVNDAGTACPAWTDKVVIECGYICLGRRTEGMEEPASCEGEALGELLAGRAYLEAVAVHAFERLERELAAHDAPSELRSEARRARRDEVRHTAMTQRLARRFGAEATLPEPPVETPVRSLFEIARENAVEGCVREMYGAVIGLLEAEGSSDAVVRRASKSIAEDECRHAELAMSVAQWIEPRLSASEREVVRRATADAIVELGARGQRTVVDLLEANVWRHSLLARAA